MSAASEEHVEGEMRRMLGDHGLTVDVTNEARVHLWYAERFGRTIPPYESTEHAISIWPTTASSVGVRYGPDREFVVCAPFGLTDLFTMTVRPNRAIVDQAVSEAKASRWLALWPRLTVVPW